MASMKQLLQQLVGVPIEIDGTNYPNAYADDLSIDRTNLEGEFVEHAERYAYYATLSEMADDRFTRLKEELENVISSIDHEKRQKYEVIKANDPKFKMTEAMFEHEVHLDARFQAKQKELQDARHLAKVLKNAPMAFAHRRDMLLELGRVSTIGLSDPRIQDGKANTVRGIIQKSRARAAMADQPAAPALPAATESFPTQEAAAAPAQQEETQQSNGASPPAAGPRRRRRPQE